MKYLVLFALLIVLSLSLSACSAVGDSPGAYSATLVLEGKHIYGRDAPLPGMLVILGGEVQLEPGGKVAGPVYLLDGTLDLEGLIEGDVAVIGGRLVVGADAQIEGDLRVGSGNLEVSPEAAIAGQVLRGTASGIQPQAAFQAGNLRERLIRVLPEALLLAGLAFLAARFSPRHIQRVSQAATRYPLVSMAMGLLAGVVGLVLLVVMAFTIILFPVTLLGIGIGFLAVGYAWAGIGAAIGRWLDGRRKLHLSPSQYAFGGTFLLMLFVNLARLLPFVGNWIYLSALTLALGSVVLTRFGFREFVPAQ